MQAIQDLDLRVKRGIRSCENTQRMIIQCPLALAKLAYRNWYIHVSAIQVIVRKTVSPLEDGVHPTLEDPSSWDEQGIAIFFR